MSNTTVAKILSELKTNEIVEVCGWVKTLREDGLDAVFSRRNLYNISC